MQALAQALRAGQKPAIQAVGKPLEEQIMLDSPEKLAEIYGPRLLIDDQGPVVVSFGLWSSSYNGGNANMAARYEEAAMRQANLDALSQIARFLNVGFSSEENSESGMVDQMSVVKDEDTGRAGPDLIEQLIIDRLNTKNVLKAQEYLQGVKTVREWTYKTENGHLLVGVIKAYRFADMNDAKQFQEKANKFKPNVAEKGVRKSNPTEPSEAFSRRSSVETNLDVF